MDARKRTVQPTAGAQKAATSDLLSFEHELRNHNFLDEFKSLVKAGCSAQWLMEALASVRIAFEHHALLQNAPARIDSRKLRTLVERSRAVAHAWEQQYQTIFGKEVLNLAVRRDAFASQEEFLNIPQRLISVAECASDIHSKTKSRRRPLYDDRLAELVEYVKLRTGDYHDREVSALVYFEIKTYYDENTLRVWRSEHPEVLVRARRRLRKH